jgi:hypothetical protein
MSVKGQYRIGQVLFVVPKNRAAVVPVKVVEEVLRKTEEGETTVYTVSWRVGKDTKTSELEKVSGEVFDNPHRLRRILIKRSTIGIDQMVATACTRAAEYGFKTTKDKDQPPESKVPGSQRAEVADEPEVAATVSDELEVGVDDQGEIVNIQLEDGTRARVRL